MILPRTKFNRAFAKEVRECLKKQGCEDTKFLRKVSANMLFNMVYYRKFVKPAYEPFASNKYGWFTPECFTEDAIKKYLNNFSR